MTDRDTRFEALLADHHEVVLKYVLRRVNEVDAADVVADVFVVAWRSLDRVPPEPRPWLYGTARKVLANHRRASQRRSALIERLNRERHRPPHDEGVSLADGPVSDALRTLSVADQELLCLIAWEELTISEAAQALQVKLPTARVRLHRARKRFAKALDDASTPPLNATGTIECSKTTA